MALPDRAYPYGLRDVKLTPLLPDGSGPSGSPVDLPAAQTFSFSETEDFAELRGDDQVQASHGNGAVCEWSLESGGISLEAYQVMAGGTIQVSGITPNIIKRFRKTIDDSRPYFKAEGRAISDNGGDFHGIVYRCKADGSLEGEMGDGEFWVSSASGKGYGSLEAADLGAIYDFVHNETAVEIPTDNNEVHLLVVDATGGTFDFIFSGQTAAAIPFNASPAALQTAIINLSNVLPGDVTVIAGPGPQTYYITWHGQYADTNVGQPTTVGTNLTGGSSDAAVTTINAGG